MFNYLCINTFICCRTVIKLGGARSYDNDMTINKENMIKITVIIVIVMIIIIIISLFIQHLDTLVCKVLLQRSQMKQ